MGVLETAPEQLVAGEQMPPCPPCCILGASAGTFPVILPVNVFEAAALVAQAFDFFFLGNGDVLAIDFDLDLFLDDDRLVDHPDHTATGQQVIFQGGHQGSAGIVDIDAIRQRPLQQYRHLTGGGVGVGEAAAHVGLGHAGEQCAPQGFRVGPENIVAAVAWPDQGAALAFVTVAFHHPHTALPPVAFELIGLFQFVLPVAGWPQNFFPVLLGVFHVSHWLCSLRRSCRMRKRPLHTSPPWFPQPAGATIPGRRHSPRAHRRSCPAASRSGGRSPASA